MLLGIIVLVMAPVVGTLTALLNMLITGGPYA